MKRVDRLCKRWIDIGREILGYRIIDRQKNLKRGLTHELVQKIQGKEWLWSKQKRLCMTGVSGGVLWGVWFRCFFWDESRSWCDNMRHSPLLLYIVLIHFIFIYCMHLFTEFCLMVCCRHKGELILLFHFFSFHSQVLMCTNPRFENMVEL